MQVGGCCLQLARNKQLDSFFVRDLNKEPQGWAAADCSFNAVTCCVSVQYLEKPELVFAEIYRVLKPGGVCIITFSNRLYFQKGECCWQLEGWWLIFVAPSAVHEGG